jgi:integrase
MRQEIQLLEDAAPMERNKLLIRLMGDTGAREGEVASLRLEDLVAKERSYFIRIRGKTGERMPPITPSVYRRLKAYAEGKSGRPRTRSTYLFLTSRRRPGGGHEPLTESGVYQAVKDAVERSGIGRRAYPHLLRHSAITHMVSGGMHPALVSDITGVSVAVIAQHYSHPTDEQRYHALMRVLDEPG